MQVLMMKHRSLWGWSVLSAMLWLMGTAVQAQWPIYDYEIEVEPDAPHISVPLALKLHNFDMAYVNAGEYHNKHFVKAWSLERYNPKFRDKWLVFWGQWHAWNEFSEEYRRAVWVQSASGVVNLKTGTLRRKAEATSTQLLARARELTKLLKNDKVKEKWEIFVQRLEHMEVAVKDLGT